MIINGILFDQYGLVVQTNGDGGDSPARTGLYYFLQYMLDNMFISTQFNFSHAMEDMQIAPGVLIRNPINYNQPNDISRDQLNPIFMALGKYPNEKKLLWLLTWKLFKNFLTYPNFSLSLKDITFLGITLKLPVPNGDISSPQDWAMIARALKLWPLYPFLLLGDFEMIINSIIRIIQGRDPNNVGNDINHCMCLWNALRYPTPFSWFARKIYAKYRPFGVQYAWSWYFRAATFANPFNILAKPLIRKWLT